MNNLTELVFIIDKSGSMSGLESDTIGGFNSMLKKQKKIEGKCFVSTIFFNGKSEVIHDRLPLEKVNELAEEDYEAYGCTALIDALGGAIHHIENIHKYAREEDVPEKTMFVITTDGMENASHIYTSEGVKKMVEKQKEKGWEFIFVAANIDAVETAKHYGIDEDRAVNYVHDAKGTGAVYESVCCAVESVRAKRTLGDNWSKEISEDFKKRNKKK